MSQIMNRIRYLPNNAGSIVFLKILKILSNYSAFARGENFYVDTRTQVVVSLRKYSSLDNFIYEYKKIASRFKQKDCYIQITAVDTIFQIRLSDTSLFTSQSSFRITFNRPYLKNVKNDTDFPNELREYIDILKLYPPNKNKTFKTLEASNSIETIIEVHYE